MISQWFPDVSLVYVPSPLVKTQRLTANYTPFVYTPKILHLPLDYTEHFYLSGPSINLKGSTT